jgi:DNA-binding MarR family transcriptional regulator
MKRAGRTLRPGAGGVAPMPAWPVVPRDRLAHVVKGVWRAFVRSLQLRLVGHGVSFGHWTFLRTLWEKDGLTQRELSERAGVMEPTTFSALKAMERLGYVVRKRMPDSRKKIYVFLTPKGRAMKRRLVPLARETNRIAVRGVKPREVSITRSTMLAMIRNLMRDETRTARTRRMPSTRELSRLAGKEQRPGPARK